MLIEEHKYFLQPNYGALCCQSRIIELLMASRCLQFVVKYVV